MWATGCGHYLSADHRSVQLDNNLTVEAWAWPVSSTFLISAMAINWPLDRYICTTPVIACWPIKHKVSLSRNRPRGGAWRVALVAPPANYRHRPTGWPSGQTTLVLFSLFLQYSISYFCLCGLFRERERERNVLFNDALNTFYLRLYGVRHMVKDHSDSENGNPLQPHRLLLSINSKGSFICTIPQTG